MIKKSIRKYFSAMALLGLSFAAWAEPKTTEYQDWVGVCAEVQGQERCEIRQTQTMENEQGNARLLTAVLGKIDGQLVLQLILPLGVDLRPGIVMQVDEKDEIRASFLTCTQEGCLAAMPMSDGLLSDFRAGNKAKVGFRPFNTEQTLVLEMSLKGFTRASQTIK